MREIHTKKYQRHYSFYNHGKTGKTAKRNRTIGAKITRNQLKKETERMVAEM